MNPRMPSKDRSAECKCECHTGDAIHIMPCPCYDGDPVLDEEDAPATEREPPPSLQ